jgi:DNA-binding XRE family transcriptional regulator
MTSNLTDPVQFRALRRENKVTIQAIADGAGISPTSVYLFEIGVLADSETKQKITGAFSQLIEEQPTVTIKKESVLQGLRGGGNHDLHQ